jgi:hypothetical protein
MEWVEKWFPSDLSIRSIIFWRHIAGLVFFVILGPPFEPDSMMLFRFRVLCYFFYRALLPRWRCFFLPNALTQYGYVFILSVRGASLSQSRLYFASSDYHRCGAVSGLC